MQQMPAAVCPDPRERSAGPAVGQPGYQSIAPGKEMPGKTLDELWLEWGRDFSAVCREVLGTGEPHQEVDEPSTIRRTPDGPSWSPAYFSWSLHRVRLPGAEGWGLLNTCWETTARKRAEEGLRPGTIASRHLVENSPFGVYAVDADFRLVQVSAGAQKVFANIRPLLGRGFAEVLRLLWPASRSPPKRRSIPAHPGDRPALPFAEHRGGAGRTSTSSNPTTGRSSG